MKSILKLTFAPLLSLFIFILGSGLFTTLLTVRLHNEGVSTLFIGAMSGAYYAGLAYGSFKIERYILNVGHIRAFAAFASFLAVLSLLQGIFVDPWIWLILRFMGGLATAGIFIVIESWLLSIGTTKIRGQILAYYMISLYAAQALGQFMINMSDPDTLMLFAITAMLSSLSVIPVALTKVPMPEISEPSSLSFKKLFKVSASGVLGSFCSGLILGALYGLLPLAIIQKMGNASDVALFMALVIFGGMFLQYPVGRLSDYIERRLILMIVSILTVIASTIIIFSFNNIYAAYVVSFILGGLTFTLYPLSISHACDGLESKDIISGTQGILLAYSIGATGGPFIAPIFMNLFGSNGLFLYFITIGAILSIFLAWRKTHVPSIPQEDNFRIMPQTTPVTAELDPRGEVRY
jgi:MFS family permease